MAPSLLLTLLLLPLGLHLVNAACPARLTTLPVSPEVINDPVCPDDHGKAIIAEDGTHYLLECCTKAHPGVKHVSRAPGIKSKKDCLEKCQSAAKCDSVEYNNNNQDCVLYELGELSHEDAPSGSHDWLFFVDPPAIPAPANITHMCSTDCPAAHGQKYVSDFGDLFHMECGKRHGTAPFKEEETATYRDCLDGCAKLPRCVSIDWSSRTKMCYYGKHSGAAPITARAWNSAYKLGCANACDKDGGDSCGCGKARKAGGP
ncbi:hypothetical protein BJY00DRAFT_293178 [Aspergillus carlsbadensis]|nr:hypothetical protein BJY00DRAFT_293178 [Aspergillus carlsbadensis]